MIFITAGTQEPFNRLIRAVDDMALAFREESFVAQALGVDFKPKHVEIVSFLKPLEFDKKLKDADLIISHAGMGTIISALMHKKKIIILPRLATLAEHRNEHQMATAKKMEELGLVDVVYDEKALKDKVSDLLRKAIDQHVPLIGDSASPELIGEIKDFIRLSSK